MPDAASVLDPDPRAQALEECRGHRKEFRIGIGRWNLAILHDGKRGIPQALGRLWTRECCDALESIPETGRSPVWTVSIARQDADCTSAHQASGSVLGSVTVLSEE